MQVTINQGALISRLFPTQKDPVETGEASYGVSPGGGWASIPEALVLLFSRERALSWQSSLQVDCNAHFLSLEDTLAPLILQRKEEKDSPP